MGSCFCRAVILNVNEPENRGLVLGMMTVLDDVGKSAGPFIVSQLIGLFHRCTPGSQIEPIRIALLLQRSVIRSYDPLKLGKEPACSF